MLADPQLTAENAQDTHQQLMQQIKKMISQEPAQEMSGQVLVDSTEDQSDNTQAGTYHIVFKPGENILQNGTNPLYLLDELHGLGTCQVIAHTEAIPEAALLDISKCYTHWEVYLTTSADENTLRDVFIFVEDECEIRIEKQDHAVLVQAQELIHEITRQATVAVPSADLAIDIVKKKSQRIY